MPVLKQLLFLLIILCPSFCFAQTKASFTVTNNGVTKNIKSGDTIRVCAGNSIIYTNTAVGINSISWKFSNGSPPTSSTFSQTVTYSNAGVGKTVQTIFDFNNNKDSLIAYVKVSNKDANLKSSFTYTPNSGNDCASSKYQFNSTSTGNGLTYYWKFGDGDTSILPKPTHSFNSAVGNGKQTFNVTLTVTDANGCTDVSNQSVTVVKIPDASLINDPSNASFNSNLFNGLETFQKCEKLSSYQFIFENNSSTTSNNSQYVFDWGDNTGTKTLTNSFKKGDTVMHTYTLGLHVLTLSVTDASTGCVAVKKYNVFLGSSPGGAFGPKNNQREFCIGDTGYFNISQVSDNPPGTIYQLHFDDGSVDSVYQHPPPTTVIHIFQKSSCGNPGGYFTATCFISNPCLTTSIATPNFYVSGKPDARMYIDPDTVACLNAAITVYNTSDFGSVATSSGCTNNGKQVWKILPSTGYTIVAGKTGSLPNNIFDYANWNNGTSSLDIKFTSAGTYTIKLYITNQKCGLDSIIKTVCARTNPQAIFKITGALNCMSDTLTLQNNTAAGGCAGDEYKWTIGEMDNENCGTGLQPEFINGDDETTKSPKVWFKEPGQYTIKLHTTALSTNNTCYDESSDTIIIKGKPKVSINSIADICVGNFITPTADVKNCYSSSNPAYKWSFINGNPNSATKIIPDTVTYNAVGLQPVTLNVTNECGTSMANTTVNVIAKPVAKAGNDTAFCSGSSVVIGTASVAGYSYSWSPVKGLNDATVAQPTVTLNYNGNNNDTIYKYAVTASLGANCFSVDTVLIKVKKSPVVTTVPSAAQVCKGGSIKLIAKGAASYVWSPATYLNTTTNDTVIVKPDTTITYNVSGSLSNGCVDSNKVTVTLNPDALASFTEKFISGCAPFDLDTIINVNTYPDRNLTYNFYANGVLIARNSAGITPSYKIQKAGDSVLIKVVAISRFGCKNDSMQQEFYSGIGVSAAFKADLKQGCEPLTVQFTNTSANLSSTNFTWDFGNGESSNNAQPDTVVYQTSSLHNDTTYYVTLKAANGCATQILKDSVRIKALPLARFGVDNTFGCSPDTITINNTSLGSPSNYYWDFDDGTSLNTSTKNSFKHVYSTGNSDTFTIKLVATNNCGKDTLPLDVVVAPNSIKAQVNVFGSDLYGCMPHTVTFNNNTTGAATALWDYGDNSFEFLDGNQVVVTHPYNDTGTFNVKVDFNNGCSDTSIYKQVIVYMHPVAAFNADKPIYCLGDSVHLNITSATGDINRLYWGDNNLFYSPPPSSHYYNNLGYYTIKLYADRVSAFGTVCSDSAFAQIKIGERPVTSESKSNDIDCFINSANLTATGGINYLWSPDTSLNNNKIANPVAKPISTTNYKVNITGTSGCVVTDSLLVKVDFSNGSNAYLIPGAFTPNGDGLNDYIEIKYPGYIAPGDMELNIYNRYGQLLFHSTNPSQRWDGMAIQNGNNVKQPPGTYVYTLRIKSICTAGTDLFKKGTIVLIR